MENRGSGFEGNNIKEELGNLENDYDLMKKDVFLLGRMEGLDGLQRLNFEEKLVRIERKCDGFGEMVVRLREDYTLLSKREDRSQERHMELTEAHLKMVEEKNKEITELKNNLKEMQKRCESFEQMMKERDMIIEACERKIECSDEIIEKMRLQEMHSCNTIKLLRRSNLKAVQSIEDLRCQRLEDDQTVVAKENALNSRLTKMEEEISGLLNIKVDDLRNVMNDSIPLFDDGGMASSGVKQSFGSGRTDNKDNAGFRNVAGGVGGTGNPVEIPHQASEETRCHSSQSTAHPIRGSRILRGSDINTIIEIIDDEYDDGPNLGRDLCSKDSCVTLSAKRKRSSEAAYDINTIIDDIINVDDDAPNLGRDFWPKKLSFASSAKVDDSSGREDLDDEACFNSLASRKNQCHQSTWMSAADLRRAFQEDDNMCLNAICVLFRQLILPEDYEVISCLEDEPEVKEVKFPHFTALSGPEVAEYLRDGDPYVRVKKSASEVKQERPEVIEICRRLALDYSERLFSIYCSGKDPLFKPSKSKAS